MKPLELLKQKWESTDYLQMNYEVQENFTFKNGETVDIGILLDGKCVAFGRYFPNIEVSKEPDSRVYFHKYGTQYYQTETEFTFYFNDNILIVNDLRQNFTFDEILNDYNVLYERIKKRTTQTN